MDTEEIFAALAVSVTEVYRGKDTLTVERCDTVGRVSVFAPDGRRGRDGWEITVYRGPLPLYVLIEGDPPVDDPRFRTAIVTRLLAWTPDPKRPSSEDEKRLATLRERLGGSARKD